jgi:hypothetical protein
VSHDAVHVLPRVAPDRSEIAGIVDVTVLMGWFTAASLTLMAYDVPSDAGGGLGDQLGDARQHPVHQPPR